MFQEIDSSQFDVLTEEEKNKLKRTKKFAVVSKHHLELLKITELDRKLAYHDLPNKVNCAAVSCLGNILRSELLILLLDTDACHACWH